MEELQKVRFRARRARSSGYREATPPVPARSSRFCPNSTSQSLVAERRADPSRLFPPPQAKRERLEQMRKMGIGKFQKVRQARVTSSVAIEPRVLSSDARRGHPDDLYARAFLASDLPLLFFSTRAVDRVDDHHVSSRERR